jgi:hypothetical protein
VTSRLTSIVPVWVLVVIGIVLIGILSPRSAYLDSLSIVLAASVIATFIAQLALSQKGGLVMRMMLSIGGSAGLVLIGTLVLLPLST